MTDSVEKRNSVETMNAEYAAILSNDKDSKERAAVIGELLIAEKENLGHGQFKGWIENNCDFSYDSAKDYMQVARTKKGARSLFDACSSIREVLRKSRTKPKPGASTSSTPGGGTEGEGKLNAQQEAFVECAKQAGASVTRDDLIDFAKSEGVDDMKHVDQDIGPLVRDGYLNGTNGTYIYRDYVEDVPPEMEQDKVVKTLVARRLKEERAAMYAELKAKAEKRNNLLYQSLKDMRRQLSKERFMDKADHKAIAISVSNPNRTPEQLHAGQVAWNRSSDLLLKDRYEKMMKGMK